MRLQHNPIVKDHDLLVDVSTEDHHPPVETERLQINSQAISGQTTYELRRSLTYSDHQIVRAILRGDQSVDIQGHTGVHAFGTSTADQSCGIGIKPINYSGYTTSYMGGYSRLHGDSYISHYSAFGDSIRLADIYIDGSEVVLEFYNTSVLTKYLKIYGTLIIK